MILTPQLTAFWDMIAVAEIGRGLLAVSDDGYNVCVGSTSDNPILFTDYSQHPRIRSRLMNSDAAGRGQFMGRYWGYYRHFLGLPDFGPDSQRRWFLQLVRECRAVRDIEEGRLDDAIYKCRSRWASLPGAGYDQPERDIATLTEAFVEAGGRMA